MGKWTWYFFYNCLLWLDFVIRCVHHLQKQATPRNIDMMDDEFILHVEGTASSQRVIRHIGKQSWPGLYKTFVILFLFYFFLEVATMAQLMLNRWLGFCMTQICGSGNFSQQENGPNMLKITHSLFLLHTAF